MEQQVSDWQEIAGPDLPGMSAQEGRPVLTPWPSRTHVSHVLLDCSLADAKPQLEPFATDPLGSPEQILRCHFLDQGHSLFRDLRLRRTCSGFVLPVQLVSLAMPPQERLWLNHEKRLLPCSRRSSEQDQKQPIRFGAGWSFHLSAQDDKLLAQERVFCHEFGRASGKVCQDPHHEIGGGVWFGPVNEAVVERLKAKACQPLDEGKNSVQSVYFPF